MLSSSNWSESYEARVNVVATGHLPGIAIVALTTLLALCAGLRFGSGFLAMLFGIAAWLRCSARSPANLSAAGPIRIRFDGSIDAANWPHARVGPRSLLLPNTLLLQVLVGKHSEAWMLAHRRRCSATGWRRLRVLWRLRDALDSVA